MKKALMILAHPGIEERSIANRIVVDAVRGLEHLRIRDLHALYPDHVVDVASEQEALIAANTIVFQFPFYWYSVPGILKTWIDEVLTYGFAYGSTGTRLHGKDFLVSTTVGGPRDAYQPDGYNHFTMAELLRPLEQLANLSGMRFHEPIISHGMIYVPGIYNVKEEVEARAREHADRLIAFLSSSPG